MRGRKLGFTASLVAAGAIAASVASAAPAAAATGYQLNVRPVALSLFSNSQGAATVNLGSVSAVLTNNGAPVAGAAVHFTTNTGGGVCDAVTDSNGRAFCGSIAQSVQTLLTLGYHATAIAPDGTVVNGQAGLLTIADTGIL
ncbi:MAG TPA: hypothetical protein VG708_10865 [Mycobacteriales bacterium]|nr:hypothetical protein [Mycobacteriales bacterium]